MNSVKTLARAQRTQFAAARTGDRRKAKRAARLHRMAIRRTFYEIGGALQSLSVAASGLADQLAKLPTGAFR